MLMTFSMDQLNACKVTKFVLKHKVDNQQETLK